MDAAKTLCDALENAKHEHLVVVTGAGVSHASGIPTFRGTDPDAVWSKDVTELGTYRYFLSDPVGSWQWYTFRFDHVLDKQPNAAHVALAELERWQQSQGGSFTLVTQNVDPLHERAGSRALIKVHGSADRVRCIKQNCANGPPFGALERSEVDFTAFQANPGCDTLPMCPACGSLLRAHVLWFDEYYDGHADYRWSEVVAAARGLSLVLFVGTSFAVGVTDLFVQALVQREVPALAIDPSQRSAPYPGIDMIAEKAEVLLPEVCRRLGAT